MMRGQLINAIHRLLENASTKTIKTVYILVLNIV